MYGILRAPRASSTEALVLSVPYRPPEASGDRTTGGAALMLALAKAFRSKYTLLYNHDKLIKNLRDILLW